MFGVPRKMKHDSTKQRGTQSGYAQALAETEELHGTRRSAQSPLGNPKSR